MDAMTQAERRRLVMELATQLPDNADDAIIVVEWLRRLALENWSGDQAERVVRLVPLVGGGADVCA